MGGFLVAASARADQPSQPLDVDTDELRPGLVTHYRSLVDRQASLTRLDPKPTLFLLNSSPHPRIPTGPFEATWTGLLLLRDPAPLSFDVYVCGEVRIEVDGMIVLQGRGERATAQVSSREPLNRETGIYRLKVHYRSLPDLPARLQVWWQGKTFTREPLPAWHLKHLAADVPKTLAQEQLADEGRAAVTELGCARCHSKAFPGVSAAPPGPALADAGSRLKRAWLLDYLYDPSRLRPDVRMPALFSADRTGFVERWLVADHLLGLTGAKLPAKGAAGDHRMGRRHFIGIGCAACHFLPDADRAGQPDPARRLLAGLGDRFTADGLAGFLENPHERYPDGRMPRLSMQGNTARDLAAFLLLWSKPTGTEDPRIAAPSTEEVRSVARRLGVDGAKAAAASLLREKRCFACHPGLGQDPSPEISLAVDSGERRGCLAGRTLPRFTLAARTRTALSAYRAVAGREVHPSSFAARQRLVEHLGCVRCHQRDSDRPPPLEAIGSTLGGAWLESLPFQRAPRLTYPHQKFQRSHLLAAVRDGVNGLRPARYTYRMPAFGPEAEAVVQALAEADGELPNSAEAPDPPVADPTLGPLSGPGLAGFQGYACVSCHLWNGQKLSEPDPGAVGTDLTRVAGRIRRVWFDRYLEGPARAHPGTPMPSIFFKGKPALLQSILDGDPTRQKEALWSYFALGKKAPSPKPPPPLPVDPPRPGEPPVVAQVPVRLPDGTLVESIALLFSSHDVFVYDIGMASLHSGYRGAQVLRGVQGRLRNFSIAGTPLGNGFHAPSPLQLLGPGLPEPPTAQTLYGYDRLPDGVRIRWQFTFASGSIEAFDTLRLTADPGKRQLLRELRITGMPLKHSVRIAARAPESLAVEIGTVAGTVNSTTSSGQLQVLLVPDSQGTAGAAIRYTLPEPKTPSPTEQTVLPDPGNTGGTLVRPGYRAIAYPRPKTVSGEDRVMPSAVAVDPRDGHVFTASMKTGELFVLRDSTGDGKQARFDNYAKGLFQEAFSMAAEPGALYVLHRRNLTRIVDSDSDGVADRFERVAGLPHGVAETYDYGYGLARDPAGAFVYSFAPFANGRLPGSGAALRMLPGQKPREVAFGLRNPVGWCLGPDGQVFFTDNQGEWVATNKLCHLDEGKFYGFPNPSQRQHTTRPAGKTAVWVPYAWAKSINGVAHDNTRGKFGPFADQLFLAELMFGGAIIRANVEKVNGVYQGACFPFWGQGLLGPLSMAFDPHGRLWVGGITEPGWMAQPDRGALFRIDFTGQVPFEMQSIHALPRRFRIVFTRPVSAATGGSASAYQVEHYRYEYTGAYGSPELDRTRLPIERVQLAADGRSVDLITAGLVKDRVYLIQAPGVRSPTGENLVHPTGAYTLNEVPRD